MSGVLQNLELFLYDNATFLSERIHAEQPTEHSVATLASCYLRQGKPKRAYALLQGTPQTALHNRYLLALSCLKLNKLHEAEGALLHDRRLRTRGPAKSQAQLLSEPCPVPHGAAGLHMLGAICQRGNRRLQAIEYFKLSLQLDPMMWVSFEALCDLGADVDASTYFPSSSGSDGSSVGTPSAATNPRTNLPFLQSAVPGSTRPPFATPPPEATSNSRLRSNGAEIMSTAGNSTLFSTPNLTPIATPNHTKVANLNKGDDGVGISGAHTNGNIIEQSVRKGSRMSFSSSVRESEKPTKMYCGHASSRTAICTAVPYTNATPLREIAKGHDADGEEAPLDNNGVFVALRQCGENSAKVIFDATSTHLLSTLYILGTAYQHLSKYSCADALDTLHKLTPQQFETGWVQHQVGRAYFEMADYVNAKRTLGKMQQAEPHRMAGLELLSTALWHLKDEVDLCYLAQWVAEFDKHSPQVWCVVGNCFSLQKEHETALKFFQRSIQLDPDFTYAYTLCGHEYVANEDFEKAICMYRHAIKTDERHYNAWYGLGAIYYRQEKYELAEYHFRKALSVNPQSSVLHCYLGMVLHANKKFNEALDLLEVASQMEPKNPQARFQRANVLISMDRYNEALLELKAVRDCAPKEASVHFLMGKVCKKLERLEEAMMHFTFALDLDPKDNNLKLAIDRLPPREV